MRKKIALVDNSTWNIFNFRLGLIRQLKNAGYEVVVIAPLDEYIRYLNETGVVQHIPLRRLSPQSTNFFRDLALVFELIGIYRREKPHLILHYTIKPNIFGNIAARLAGIPSISTITGLGYTFLHRSLINRMVPGLYRLAFRWTQRVIFYNNEDFELFAQRRIIPAAKGAIVPGSGVNTNHFRPLPKPDSSAFVYLFIGRLLYDKGLREFVEAAQEVRRLNPLAECWIIGELNAKNPAAVEQAQMIRWMEEGYVKYWGIAADVRHFIRRANVVVLPSYREGVPRSILEAMAMGTPIITTDAAGCRDTVKSQLNGWIVPPADSKALAAAMLEACHMPQADLLQMGEYSRQIALTEFDEKIITGRYLHLINGLLHQGTQVPVPQHSLYE